MKNITDVRFLISKAKTYESQLRIKDAIDEYENILSIYPRNIEVRSGYAGILKSLGDLEKAQEILLTGIELNKEAIGLYINLIKISKDDILTNAFEKLNELYSLKDLNPKQRISSEFAYGDYYDKIGDYDNASVWYNKANDRLSKLSYKNSRGRYNPQNFETKVNNLIKYINDEFISKKLAKRIGLTTKEPVYIIGMPRSGTTLTERILSTHSNITGIGESKILGKSFNGLVNNFIRGVVPPEAMVTLNENSVKREADSYYGQLMYEKKKFSDKATERTVDKMPDNYLNIPWALYMFPNTRIFYIKRDFRDIALSCYMTNFASIRWASNLEHLAHRIILHNKVMDFYMEKLLHVFPENIITINYSDLVTNTESTVKKMITEDLELKWESNTITHFHTGGYVKTASVNQVRKPIYTSSLNRWKKYENMLEPLVVELGDIV
jgi:tetratricopeptide (TPR) repeat protein